MAPTIGSMSPFFIVSDVSRTISFYVDMLGFEVGHREPAQNPFFAIVQRDGAMLFGSAAQLFTGSEGVRTYFSKLPAGIKAKMGDQQAIAVGPNVLLSSGFADFTLKDGTVLPFRLTLAMVKVDGHWLIAQHHGSPVPK